MARISLDLEWSQCFKIICWIARGLLCLQHDSRLRIIHREKDMKPKISDFGVAKTLGGDQIEGYTNRVAGILWIYILAMQATSLNCYTYEYYMS